MPGECWGCPGTPKPIPPQASGFFPRYIKVPSAIEAEDEAEDDAREDNYNNLLGVFLLGLKLAKLAGWPGWLVGCGRAECLPKLEHGINGSAHLGSPSPALEGRKVGWAINILGGGY